jgi:tetratricopeptide (TPR) repeat protein
MGQKQSNQNKSAVQSATSSIGAAVAQEPSAVPPAPSVSHLFKKQDWLAALATTLFSGAIFFYYMAPEVTLQDSGELVTGAFTFGVPHPPGYPLWAFLGFIWSHLIIPFGNPAWRIGMMSVATGACAVGVLTLTMTRSTRLLLNSLPTGNFPDERVAEWIAMAVGVSTGLLFGFNRGVWLWACVSEMRVLNVFSFVLITCIFFGWMVQQERRGFLYAAVFLFGVSLANHQTIAIMAVPFAVGPLAVGLERFFEWRRTQPRQTDTTRMLMTSLCDFWELGSAAGLAAMTVFLVFAWLQTPDTKSMMTNQNFWLGLTSGIIALIILTAGNITRWWNSKRALVSAGLLHLGISFYLYMPLAASTNPPMNWGYAATKEGFLHAITRGQYEKLKTADFMSSEFRIKIQVFTDALIGQYSLPLTFLALVALVFLVIWWLRWKPGTRAWMVFIWTAFLATSLGLLTIINPKLERQEQEITIKFFAPAHGFFAMLIGYGIALVFSLAAWLWKKKSMVILRLACIGLLALPVITYQKNWSLCALRGHDFGYLFGYLMFNPGGGYPEMDRDAVLYGGTDPGRFVPTYMIFCESRVLPRNKFRDPNFDRSDVYIITQNALADGTYMNYIRDHYDVTRPKNDGFLQRLLGRDKTYPVVPIRIPSPADSAAAFRKYVQDVQAGIIPPSADLKIENDRVSVSGALGVMAINGILAQWIFEQNKEKHSFYVEESYVISWMYPYLAPHGIIMKINKDPLPSPQADPGLWTNIVARDKAYWDKLTSDFLARPEFVRNNDAKKSFSKLRSAIAGLYYFRGLLVEAEYAFKQSLNLCPESPEANFRLADLYNQQHRYPEAIGLIEKYLKFDVFNKNAQGYLGNIKSLQADDMRRISLEQQIQGKSNMDINVGLELASLYQRLNMEAPFQALTRSILSMSNLPPNVCSVVIKMYSNGRRWDLLETALKRYMEIDPSNFRAWLDFGYVQTILNKTGEAVASLKKAVELAGEEARVILRQDPRFAPLRHLPEFRSLAFPSQQLNTRTLPKLLDL